MDLSTLARTLEALTGHVQRLADAWAPAALPVDWTARAYRWRKKGGAGHLEAVHHIADIAPHDLFNIDRQKTAIEQNTRQFVNGLPANNVLLTGARGTGKSSLVRAMLHAFSAQGLRLIEVDKADLVDLADIVDLIAARPERFIVFCDDLSFEEGEPAYKALKSVLDGSVSAPTDNLLIYATSNRRHLMPEYMHENLQAKVSDNGEIHPGETVEEKISLSERFGLWVSFYTFSQDDYLRAVRHWLSHFDVQLTDFDEGIRADALRWTLERGSRSGRVAFQFAKHWAGMTALRSKAPSIAKPEGAPPVDASS